MNLDKLDAAIAYIEAHPDEHDQGYWFTKGDGGCGTTCCLAGAVVLLDGWVPAWGLGRHDDPDEAGMAEKDGVIESVPAIAREILGISTHQSDLLFHASNSLEHIKHHRDKLAGVA